MLPHPCREPADKFSFSDSTDTTKPEGPNPPEAAAMEYGKWAEKIKGKYNYFGRPEDVKFGAWSRKSSVSDRDRDGDKSGTPSPELWKAAGKLPASVARSAEVSPAGSRRFDEEDRHISNGSRATSIAKYRQEMLDLVRDIPENSYELSLIDIVESPKVTERRVTETTAEEEEEEEEEKSKKKNKKIKKGGIMRRVSRSDSLDSGGLMLKMFIPRMPVVLGGRRQQTLSKSGKVSPSKPSSVDGEGDRGSTEFGDQRASSTSSRNSNSSSSTITTTSSRNSTNSRGSSVSSRFIGSCYPFAHRGKSMGVDD